MSDAQPIDYVHLDRYVAGDPDLTREVFGMFVHQMEMWGRGLTADADDEVWASVTHSIKGSAKAVGAMTLAMFCEKAEALIGQGNRLGARDVAVQNIEFEADRVKAEIARWEHAQSLRDLRSS
jgi:HPt (histidine-containing phosphotransfer) domain-containing protein